MRLNVCTYIASAGGGLGCNKDVLDADLAFRGEIGGSNDPAEGACSVEGERDEELQRCTMKTLKPELTVHVRG